MFDRHKQGQQRKKVQAGKNKRSSMSDAPSSETLSQEEVAKHIDRLVEQYREDLTRTFGRQQEVQTLDQIEEGACEVRDRVGKAVVQEITQAQVDIIQAEEAAQNASKAQCKECEKEKPLRCTTSRTIVTMAGDVTVARRGHYCRRCDVTTFPIDARLQLPCHAFTARVEQKVVRYCVKDTFMGAMEDFQEETGVRVSAKEAQRMTLAIGEWLQRMVQVDIERVLPQHPKVPHLIGRSPNALEEQIHDPTKTGYVLLDGVMTPMQDGSYREAKIGNVVLVDELMRKKVSKDGQEQGKVMTNLYSHTLEGPQEAGKQLYSLAARAGITEMSRLAALGDGAHWIWNQVQQYFPQATCILDWRHAQEYLNEVAKTCMTAEMNAAKGAKGAKEALGELQRQIKEWVTRVETFMWEGDVNSLIQAIEQLPAPTVEARECLRETVTYYNNNRKRMNYPQYRAKGFFIGSGRIESGCKQVVTARMKGAGMRWGVEGAKAVGCLRALFLSPRRWNEVISQWPGRSSTPIPIF